GGGGTYRRYRKAHLPERRGCVMAAREVASSALTCDRYNKLGLYWAFARVGFINTLAYRLRYYTGIVTYFIYVSVYYFIWKAIYAHSSSIEGFDFRYLLTYIGVGWIIRSFYFNNIDQDLFYQVIEGRIAMDLIKPVNIQLMYVSRAAGESVFRLA